MFTHSRSLPRPRQSMCFWRLFLVLTLVLAGCAKSAPTRPTPPPAPTQPVLPTASPSAPLLTSTLPPTPQPVSFEARYTYDAAGNLVARTAPDGATARYEYDVENRLTRILHPDGSGVSYDYDVMGRRTRMTDPLGTTSYAYDIHGRLVKITDPNRNTLQYAYDPSGLLTQMVYPDSSAAAFAWDVNGQLATVQDVSGITSYEYDLGGKLTGRTLPNGVVTRYEYDDATRLTVIRHTSSSGALLLGFEYELDAAGNRTQVTRTDANSTQVTHYEYDSLNRLVQVAYPDGEEVTYEYDATGNRTKMVSSKTEATRYSYNSLGWLTELDGPAGKVTFAYDAGGNLMERADMQLQRTTRYTWDYENRLVGVDDGTTKVSYEYDGDGNRIGKIVNGKSTEYVNSTDGFMPQTLSETNSDGETRNYSYGLERIGQIDSGGLESFYLTDGLEGSVSNLTDSEGRITDSYAYDGFGITTVHVGGSGNPFAYDGEYADGETGLIFLRNRYYDPAIGRFLSSDVRMGSQVDPQSLNHYAFVSNNPVNLVDPLGLEGWVRGAWLAMKSRVRTSFMRDFDLNPNLLLLDAIGEKLGLNWFGETISGGRYILPGGVGSPRVKSVNWVDWWAMKHDFEYYAATNSRGPVLVKKARVLWANTRVAFGILGESILRGMLTNEVVDSLDFRQYGEYTRGGPSYDDGGSSGSVSLSFHYIGGDSWDEDQKRYPFYWDADGGGGGGGATVGGVSLDKAAEMLVI